MILAAYQHYRQFVESVYEDLLEQDRILTLDHPLRVTTAVQGVEGGQAVQLFVPQIIKGETPASILCRAQVMVLAPSVNDALLLADRLTETLKPSVRRPTAERNVQTTSRAGAGYGVVDVGWNFSKKP